MTPCPRCLGHDLQELLTPPFGSWCPCGFTVPEVDNPETFEAYLAAERFANKSRAPIVLMVEQLPTDQQLAIVHADLDALIACGRLVVGELIGDEFEAEVARG